MRQLFPSLTNLDLSQGLTKEQAAQFQQGFQALAAQGAPAVAGIGEFLDKNLDWVFGGETAESAGAASLRAGLLDSLRQIGGPEALALSRGVLQNTTDPLEIALLSRNLEEAAPGQYTQEAVDAARQALSTLAQDHVTNVDAAPLFQVLQTYGGTAAAADLAKAAPEWNYYGPIALAELPSGQGIPALIQLAQDPAGLETGNNKFALQMLAQVASKYPAAAAALVDLAGHNQITDGTWLSIGGGLSGDQYQFARQFPQNTPAVAARLPGYHFHQRRREPDFLRRAAWLRWLRPRLEPKIGRNRSAPRGRREQSRCRQCPAAGARQAGRRRCGKVEGRTKGFNPSRAPPPVPA